MLLAAGHNAILRYAMRVLSLAVLMNIKSEVRNAIEPAGLQDCRITFPEAKDITTQYCEML